MSKGWRYPNINPPGKEVAEERRISLLDHDQPESALNKSKFRGFFNFALVFVGLICFSNCIIRYDETGQFFDKYMFETFKQDIWLCAALWPLFFLWSFISFFLEKLIIMGIPKPLALIIQVLTQPTLFLFTAWIISQRQWCASHVAYAVLQTCVHWFKMHSYTTVNRDYRNQAKQAKKKGEQPLTDYPKNVTINDFILYMWTPWLVYKKYPRRKGPIRIKYILSKMAFGFTGTIVSYIIWTEYYMPWVYMGANINIVELIARDMLPGIAFIIVVFHVVFESSTGFFAQITKLDDREYFQQWWNSTTYEQYNRKWNKPVHNFLYQHIYIQLIVKYKQSKAVAQICTFAFSAILHEYLLGLGVGVFRPYFSLMMILQIPLFMITKSLKGTMLGNYHYWQGIILGPTLALALYLRLDPEIANKFARPETTF